jgi:hypothetical protein
MIRRFGLELFFLAWSQAADVLCTEVNESEEGKKVRGGKHIDVRRSYVTSKVMTLSVGCYESELCVCAGDQGCIHSTNSVAKCFLKWKQTERNEEGPT